MKIKTSKLKRLMRAKGMTYESLSIKMKLGSKQAAWYRIHNAKSTRTIDAVAKALGVKANDIV